MGSFLEKPVTAKHTETHSGNGLRCGLSAMQGWRVDMEDAHTVALGIGDDADFSWFGVFDGHGGAFTSQYSARQILAKITATPEWKADRKNLDNLKRAIVRGFLEMDEELRQQPDIQRGDDHSGSTAITSLLTPTHILVGNCGDSRAILVRGGEAVEMSQDHKPYNEGEQRRIEAAGGTVTMRRVNGDLAVSRALGDFVYKHARDLPAEQQQVSAEPEVKVEERTDADQFLVLACDGVWDVMSNREVGEFVLKKTEEGVDDLGEMAELLIDECLNRGSRDNMSAVIVAFKNAPRPSSEAIANRKRELAAAAAAAGGTGAVTGGGAAGSAGLGSVGGEGSNRNAGSGDVDMDDDEPDAPRGQSAAGSGAAGSGNQ